MNVSCQSACEGAVIILSGEIDHHSARGAMNSVSDFICERSPMSLTFDLSGVPFMDSSGIALLLGAYRRVFAYGGEISVRGENPQVHRVLSAAGIYKIIKGEEEQ